MRRDLYLPTTSPSCRAHDGIRQPLDRNDDYADYANITTRRCANYPIYTKDSALILSAGGDYALRSPQAVPQGTAGHRRDHVSHH